MDSAEPQRRFFDASILGAGLLLGESDPLVIFPGHPDWPFSPRTKDEVWLPHVGERGWTAFLRDKHLRSRLAERDALIQYRVRVVNITVRENLSPAGYVDLIGRFEDRIRRLETEPPAYYHLTTGGIRLHLSYDPI